MIDTSVSLTEKRKKSFESSAKAQNQRVRRPKVVIKNVPVNLIESVVEGWFVEPEIGKIDLSQLIEIIWKN